MKTHVFEYGPVARGAYIMLLWLTLPVALNLVLLGKPLWLLAYIALLVFLGLFFRSFLVWSGIYGLYQGLLSSNHDAYNQRVGEKTLQEIKKREQVLRYKGSRIKHPELPRNW